MHVGYRRLSLSALAAACKICSDDSRLLQLLARRGERALRYQLSGVSAMKQACGNRLPLIRAPSKHYSEAHEQESDEDCRTEPDAGER